jgi:hypothetical protein
MEPSNSADSVSAAVNVVAASPVARAQRFQVTAFRTTLSPQASRWYVRCRLSSAEVSEWLVERVVLVDQSTIYRWVQRFRSLFGEVAQKHRDPVGPDWRVDDTYARIRGRWHFIYRAIDGHGQIVDAYGRAHASASLCSAVPASRGEARTRQTRSLRCSSLVSRTRQGFQHIGTGRCGRSSGWIPSCTIPAAICIGGALATRT